MSPGAQQQQNDNSLGPLWIMLGICVVIGVTWYIAHEYIVYGIFKLKLAEIAVISIFTNKLGHIQQIIHTLPPADVSLSQLGYICAEVGKYIRIPCIIMLLVFAVLIYRSGSASSFTQIYNMKNMLELEQKKIGIKYNLSSD